MIKVSDWRRIAAKLRGYKKLAVATALALCLPVLAASLWMVYSRPVAPSAPTQEELERPFKECVRRAESWRARSDMDQTLKWFGKAIDCAISPDDRARASLEMGRLLLARAEKKPKRNAEAARQYFRAVIDIEKEEPRKFEAYRGVIKASDLLHDKGTVLSTVRTALALATNVNEIAELYLMLVDAHLNHGTPSEVEAILEEARPFTESPPWNEQYKFKKVEAVQRVLTDEQWFRAYAEQYPTNDPQVIREEALNKIVEQYRKIAEEGTSAAQEECLFRIAEVYIQEKRYDEGRKAMQSFVARQPTTHVSKSLMLLLRLARIAGDDAAVQKMLVKIVNRYRVDERTLGDVLAILDEMEQGGHSLEALKILRPCLRIEAMDRDMSEILYRAGKMSLQLGFYNDSILYFSRLLETPVENPMRYAAMMGQADACLLQTNWAGAEKYLLDALVRYPRDENRGQALIRLFDVTVRKGAPPPQVLLVGTAVIQASPRDPRAVEIHMTMAKLLEKTGLLSLAEEEYSQIAVLNFVGTTASRTGTLVSAVSQATLGKARCLLNMGEVVRADRLLREICRTDEPGPIRSEAAYLWATIALADGQLDEGMRRLGLIDPRDASPEIATHVEVEKALAEISTGLKTADTINQVLASLATMTDEEQTALVRRAYTAYFGWLVGQGDLSAIQDFIERTAKGPHAKKLPLGTWALRLAGTVLARQGVTGFADCLSKNVALVGEPGTETVDARLLDSARQVEKSQSAVARFL
jgi:tetratricopeptide (TPR) repeat protein